jgi:hypothetical protein
MIWGLCEGVVVVFNVYLALACAAMRRERVYPLFRLPQLPLGIKPAGSPIAFLAVALGVAFGQRWARWVSLAFGALSLCSSAFLFRDGYLRIKPHYSGEESSEVFGAIVSSGAALCVLAAMSAGRAVPFCQIAGDDGTGIRFSTHDEVNGPVRYCLHLLLCI